MSGSSSIQGHTASCVGKVVFRQPFFSCDKLHRKDKYGRIHNPAELIGQDREAVFVKFQQSVISRRHNESALFI